MQHMQRRCATGVMQQRCCISVVLFDIISEFLQEISEGLQKVDAWMKMAVSLSL